MKKQTCPCCRKKVDAAHFACHFASHGGSVGGKATGIVKRRGDSDYYRRLAAQRKIVRNMEEAKRKGTT